jgi:hypothetical protein
MPLAAMAKLCHRDRSGTANASTDAPIEIAWRIATL